MNELLFQYPTYQIILFILLCTTFIIQLIYLLKYGSITGHRHGRRYEEGEKMPPVSIVVIVQSGDEEYIEEHLPLLLEQQYDEFEVVVVNDCAGNDINILLSQLASRYSNLKFTTLKKDIRFAHSRKIPLVVGIKAASHGNIIFTDTNASPTNEKWLSQMACGFLGGELVIGYCGIEPKKGFANKMIRCSRMAQSIRYLSAAVSSKAYRGIYNNIGYTKRLFFSNRGYTHLRLALGEDDLFVAKVATRQNTSIILSPRSTMRQKAKGSLSWWFREELYRSYAFRYYPTSVKISQALDFSSRFLFLATAITLGILHPHIMWIVAASLFFFRTLTLILIIRSITRRIAEPGLILSYLLYDIISPISETIKAIVRRVKPNSGLWK